MHSASQCRGVRSNRTQLILLGALLPLVMPLSAHAATEYWKVTNGNWNLAANWSSAADLVAAGATPVAADTANIWNNDATNRTITLNANASVTALNIANIGTGTSTFAQGTFNLTSVNESIGGRGNGNNAHGAYTQSGGANTLSGFLAVGDDVGSTGTYTMTGGTLTTAGSMLVGVKGGGQFNQTAGTTTINGNLDVADSNSGSSGSVTVGPGATLKVNGQETSLGGSLPGNGYGPASLTVQGNVTVKNLNLNQTGTLNLVSGGTLTVGHFSRRAGGSAFSWTGGTLNLLDLDITHATDTSNSGPFGGNSSLDNNVTLNVANLFSIGGTPGYLGQFAQNAGTINIGTPTTAGSFQQGLYGSAGGNYSLSNTATLKVFGNVGLNSSTTSVNGGTMTVTGNLDATDRGTLNVGGGSLSIGGVLTSHEHINQSGGALTVAGATNLAAAVFTQSGGTATLNGAVNASGGGTIHVSDTAHLTANGVVTIGNTNTTGLLDVSGGSMTVNNALVSSYFSAAINVSGGTLTANHLYYNGPVNVTGGTLNAGQSRSDGGAFNLSGGNATIGAEFDLPSGGKVNVSGTGALKVNGSVYVGGNSTSVGGSSNLTITGGSVNITDGLIDYVGPVQLSAGSLTTGSFTVGSTYTQSGGTLTTPSLLVGDGAKAAFNGGTTNISGGTVSVLNGGTLSGVATINSPATINGNVQPGSDAAVGILNMSGADTFGATSHTRLRIAAFSLSDHLNTGSATLGGTLQLGILNNYVPVAGNSYVVMTGNPVQGQFSQITGNQLANGHWLAVTYSNFFVSVSAALGGDANLDGTVNFNDLVALAQHYSQSTGQTWSTGDFNGSGGVDFNDLVVLAQNYNQSTSGPITLPANFVADWALAQSLVPEPTSMLVLALAAHGLMQRRRPV
jgi:hypothetical protein